MSGELRFPAGCLPRCTNYFGGRSRCPNLATVLLYAPGDQPCPGCYRCAPCAEATIAEYRDKLGVHWTARQLVEVRSFNEGR